MVVVSTVVETLDSIVGSTVDVCGAEGEGVSVELKVVLLDNAKKSAKWREQHVSLGN